MSTSGGKKVRNLFYLTYPDIQDYLKKCDIVLIPIGSCEQHGPHLPVATDSIATELPTQLAAEKADVLYTPTIWFGYSPQHLKLPGEGSGTVTLTAETYNRVIYEVGRSLIHQGFNKLVYATGHTSNIKVIDPALRALRYDTGAFVALFRNDAEGIPPLFADILENPPEETPGWHGSEIETSEVLNFNPDLVHLERTGPVFPHAPRFMGNRFKKKDGSPYVSFEDGWEGYYIPMDHHEYSDNGLIGNPARATAEKGRIIVERLASRLAEFIEELKKMKVEVYNRSYWGAPRSLR
ncbi:MAG: creatininase family protein [Nitrososphaerota archaeon]